MNKLKSCETNNSSLFHSNKQFKEEKYLVSVLVITYKHEKYIKECLDGILKQICNFKVEIVIANDCSPDSSNKIIQEIVIENQNPIWIKYLCPDKNIGAIQNFISALTNCTGRYIAICEGDDYWTDSYKLQKQVNFLERNQDCIISYHNCEKIMQESKQKSLIYKPSYNKKLSINDLFKGDYAKTCTMVFRNSQKINYNQVFDDTTLGMELLKNGGFAYYIPDIMSVYRIHSGGIWSQRDALYRYKLSFDIEKKIKNFYSNSFPKDVELRLSEFFRRESLNLALGGFWIHSFKCFLGYFSIGKFELYKFKIIGSLLKICFRRILKS